MILCGALGKKTVPRGACQTVVGRIVCGGGAFDFRENRLHRVFPPSPRTLATCRPATEWEISDVEEAIAKGWLQITDEPVSGVQYGQRRLGFGILVLHQATGRNQSDSGGREMSDEQAGPPTEAEREQRDIEWVRRSQMRYVEGYKARMAELHPFRKNSAGEVLQQRERRWSFADMAELRCPGFPDADLAKKQREELIYEWPAHERERWIAGYLQADRLGSEHGIAAMERGDPSRPPPRPKRAVVAVQQDGMLDLSPPLEKKAAREWWDHHHGKTSGYSYRDAGEQP